MTLLYDLEALGADQIVCSALGRSGVGKINAEMVATAIRLIYEKKTSTADRVEVAVYAEGVLDLLVEYHKLYVK